MQYKRHLPHWLPEGAILHVRWRLANSLPAPKPEFLSHKYQTPSGPSGPLWLTDPRIAQVVVDAIRYGEEQKKLYELFAYAVMPNHVRMLVEPYTSLPTIMRWLKGRTVRVANRILGRKHESFWMDESYDHIIRTAQELKDTIRYIENNPVRARLVDSPELWRWSSAFDRPQTAMACPTKEIREGDGY